MMRSTLALTLLFSVACSDSGTAGSPSGLQGQPEPEGQAEGNETPANDATCEVPTETAALLQWLNAGSYAKYAQETSVHDSAGPHGGNVKVFLNAALDASLRAGNKEHPRCSVSVKELYGSSKTEVQGWAVGVKLADTSASGKSWYWMETFSKTGSPDFAGKGLALCANCHSDSPRDQVLIEYPLR